MEEHPGATSHIDATCYGEGGVKDDLPASLVTGKAPPEGLLGSSGGFARKFPEGGLDFLELALVWKFQDGSLPKQTSKKFASEPP